jgi:hypothetical protein
MGGIRQFNELCSFEAGGGGLRKRRRTSGIELRGKEQRWCLAY